MKHLFFGLALLISNFQFRAQADSLSKAQLQKCFRAMYGNAENDLRYFHDGGVLTPATTFSRDFSVGSCPPGSQCADFISFNDTFFLGIGIKKCHIEFPKIESRLDGGISRVYWKVDGKNRTDADKNAGYMQFSTTSDSLQFVNDIPLMEKSNPIIVDLKCNDVDADQFLKQQVNYFVDRTNPDWTKFNKMIGGVLNALNLGQKDSTQQTDSSCPYLSEMNIWSGVESGDCNDVFSYVIQKSGDDGIRLKNTIQSRKKFYATNRCEDKPTKSENPVSFGLPQTKKNGLK